MSVSMVFLPIFILLVLAIGVLVYFICYKAMINKRLRERESETHVPMASTETVFKWVLIIGVLVLYSSLNSKLVTVREELENMRSSMYAELSQVQGQLYEMQEKAKKDASMVSGINIGFGEIYTEDDTVEVKFFAVPKSYSTETEMSLVCRGETIPLTNEGNGRFAGSKRFPLFEESYEAGVICITEDGVTKTEAWEDAPQGRFSDKCLPHLLVAKSYFGYHKKKNSVKIEGELNVMSSEKNAEQFRELTLYVKKGDQVLEEIALKNGSLSLDKEYSIKAGDSFTIYVTGIDRYGYTHKEHLAGWNTDEMDTNTSYAEESQYVDTEWLYEINVPE